VRRVNWKRVSDGLKKRFGSGDLEIGDPKAAVSVVLFFDLGLIRVEWDIWHTSNTAKAGNLFAGLKR
jgi:hypothetical protein